MDFDEKAKQTVTLSRLKFFNTMPKPAELTGDYLKRLNILADICDFNSFGSFDALLYNLLRFTQFPAIRDAILLERMTMDEVRHSYLSIL